MVANKNVPYPDQELFDYVVKELDKRGIDEWTVGNAAYAMQHQYYPDVTVEQFGSELTNVLKKREVLNNLAVGFALDNFANRSLLPEPLQTIVANDLGNFTVDESLALNITQLYGTVSSTNYGHADKEKIGFAKELDNSNGEINTFSDDLFSALASAVCARFAHGSALQLDESTDQSERIDDHIESLKADLAKIETTNIVDEMKKAIKGIPNSCDQTDQTNLDAEPKNLCGWTYKLKRKDTGEDLQETDSQSVDELTSIVKSDNAMSSVKAGRDGLTITLKTSLNNDEPIDWDEMPSLDKTALWQEATDKAKQRTYEAIDRELSTKPMIVHPFGDLNSAFEVTAVSPENETPNHKYVIVSEISLFKDLFEDANYAVYCLTYEELYDTMNDLYQDYSDSDDYDDFRKLMHDAIEIMIADFEDDEE
ncbi:phosphatidylglycerophosphatase A [Limosilactobacillus mucosae]|uniref:phosphatidylglycerophosphatase A n=1 Tax=Limosilactobacillus mucosae TaxID=97478 RepID=UPI0002504234|nr:phosphatidylglycerophosphatase A [Limosilactobacillus mucosae]